MAVQITHDDVIGDVAGRGRELAALPEALPPVAFPNVLELLLDFSRRPALCPAYKVADRDMRRDFDEHMHVIARQCAVDYGHAHFIADLLMISRTLRRTSPMSTLYRYFGAQTRW